MLVEGWGGATQFANPIAHCHRFLGGAMMSWHRALFFLHLPASRMPHDHRKLKVASAYKCGLSSILEALSSSTLVVHTLIQNTRPFILSSTSLNTVKYHSLTMSSSDNTSSLKSVVDTATGYVQSGIATLTGSAGDQVQQPQSPTQYSALTSHQAKADEYKNKGAVESDLSHTAAKAGPFTISSSGAPAKDNPDRTQGQWDQTIGSAKETIGGLLGNENLKQQGREQNLQGQGQEAKGQLSDLGQGISDRAQGTLGGAVAGLTGDREAQAKYADQHDEGKTRQRGVELDLDKQVKAQEKSSS